MFERPSRSEPQSRNLFQIIEEKNWDTLKHFSTYWHSLKRDLSTTPTGCILYDGKLFIPTQLRKLVTNSIHRNHPGQSGMMHLANLIWFPRIHRERVTLTQNCQPCIKIGKNLKPIIPKSKIAHLPPLQEPNEEIELDFAGPITDKQQKNSYILTSKWSKITLADKIAEIIQKIKIIPNSTTKKSPSTAHFGRKHNTPISNITTQTSTKTYHKKT